MLELKKDGYVNWYELNKKSHLLVVSFYIWKIHLQLG